MAEYTSNGGGATHIAKVTGQLKDLSSNLSDILMVSGGGGGGLVSSSAITDMKDMTDWTPDGDFGWTVSYDSSSNANHITGTANDYWEYYEWELPVQRNTEYTVSMIYKGTGFSYFAHYDCLRVLDRYLSATQIRTDDGLKSAYIIAESSTHFSNTNDYVSCSVTFNSGDRDSVWLYIGAGYVLTGTSLNLYFKDIQVDVPVKPGKDAGGISGNGDNSADQSTGYGFGQGESGANVSGGGSGLYGGYKGNIEKGGGAGSGYIGNSSLSSKKMIGFNVPTSSDAGTKTESVNIYSETRIAEVPKVGDGWARIKLLQAVNDNLLEWRTLTKDKNHYKFAGYNKSINELSDYFGSDWILYAGQANYNKLSYYDGAIGTGTYKIAETSIHIYIPIRPIVATKIRFKAKMNTGGSYAFIFMNLGYIENNQMQQVWSDKTVGTYDREWVELTKMLDTPKEVQYVIVEACDYVYNFKDFEFNYE